MPPMPAHFPWPRSHRVLLACQTALHIGVRHKIVETVLTVICYLPGSIHPGSTRTVKGAYLAEVSKAKA